MNDGGADVFDGSKSGCRGPEEEEQEQEQVRNPTMGNLI